MGLKIATNAKAGKVPGRYEMPSLGLLAEGPAEALVGLGSIRKDQGQDQVPTSTLSLYSCEVEKNTATMMPWACLSFLGQRYVAIEEPGQPFHHCHE